MNAITPRKKSNGLSWFSIMLPIRIAILGVYQISAQTHLMWTSECPCCGRLNKVQWHTVRGLGLSWVIINVKFISRPMRIEVCHHADMFSSTQKWYCWYVFLSVNLSVKMLPGSKIGRICVASLVLGVQPEPATVTVETTKEPHKKYGGVVSCGIYMLCIYQKSGKLLCFKKHSGPMSFNILCSM